MTQDEFQNLGNEQDAEDQSQVEKPEDPDSITLLTQELKELRAGNSSLMKRLESIESKISQPERERALPKQITWSQLSNRKFLLANKIDLSDISSGRIEVIKG
jgi:hypothetical protein